ncbi:hypothetical protein FB45DRAFT_868652 [Roridomyces roridus]|uniref:Protein kinase domain-containing protein n=1 Tax=Roridomyces roridus TaxID=1738132 RepID=A0AAD7BQD2_9AGAR|nr:hypothetical protein FB45DRAFT_868652 [Roridomyces roridus]
MIARPCAASRRTPSLLPTKKALSQKICVRLPRCFPQGTAGALDDEMVHPQPRIKSTGNKLAVGVAAGVGWASLKLPVERAGIRIRAAGLVKPDSCSIKLVGARPSFQMWRRPGRRRSTLGREAESKSKPFERGYSDTPGISIGKEPDIYVERSVGYDCSRKLRSSLLCWGRGNHRLHANLTQHLAGCISADAKTTYKNVMARKNQKLGRPIETCGRGGPGGHGDNQGGEGGYGQGPRVNFYDIRAQSVGIRQEIYPGTFLPGAEHTTIHEGNLPSNVQIHQVLPTVEGTETVSISLRNAEFDHATSQDDYRRIPRGDIFLLREIRLKEPDVVRRNEPRNFARRIFSAKVHPMESEKAVVLYDGGNAEGERRKYVERHSKFWHPNILQIFGLANHCGNYAVVIHEDLMPYGEFLALHRPSPVMTVYLVVCWRDAQNLDFISLRAFAERDPAYSSSKTNIFLDMVDDGTQWIRCSTGRLCVEFESSDIDELRGRWYPPDLPMDAPLVLNNPDFETQLVQILTESDYRIACRMNLSKQHTLGSLTQAEVRVGVIAGYQMYWSMY